MWKVPHESRQVERLQLADDRQHSARIALRIGEQAVK
jgi:hypothetical protein